MQPANFDPDLQAEFAINDLRDMLASLPEEARIASPQAMILDMQDTRAEYEALIAEGGWAPAVWQVSRARLRRDVSRFAVRMDPVSAVATPAEWQLVCEEYARITILAMKFPGREGL